MLTYEIYEDNAGGLYFCVIENDKCIRIFEDFEYGEPGILLDAIKDLENYQAWDGDLVARFASEGFDYTAQDLYDMKLGYLIADQDTIYYDKMGYAGRRAFERECNE